MARLNRKARAMMAFDPHIRFAKNPFAYARNLASPFVAGLVDRYGLTIAHLVEGQGEHAPAIAAIALAVSCGRSDVLSRNVHGAPVVVVSRNASKVSQALDACRRRYRLKPDADRLTLIDAPARVLPDDLALPGRPLVILDGLRKQDVSRITARGAAVLVFTPAGAQWQAEPDRRFCVFARPHSATFVARDRVGNWEREISIQTTAGDP
jgi:hypothetical protein